MLVSALGEEVDRASLAAARKVFVDGFMAASEAYEVQVPQVPLGELFGRRVENWLTEAGVQVVLGAAVEQVEGATPHEGAAPRATAVRLAGGERQEFDAIVVALPWRRAREAFDDTLASQLPELARLDEIESAPISGVHLWFDREITPLPHAVLVGKQSQWLFNRGRCKSGENGALDRPLLPGRDQRLALARRTRPRQAIREIVGELASIWPAAGQAELLHARLVTEQTAVFSLKPGLEQLRPTQQTAISNLALAGDWTGTGWPATMEGAVRSGYLAAEAILKGFGQNEKILVDDLPRGRLARMML